MKEPDRQTKKFELKVLESVNNPNSIHGIFPYRGKISGLDAKNLIEQLPKNATLLDPFCGSGTIIYEARKHGMNAIGLDNNPIAFLISKGKNTTPAKAPSNKRVEEILGLAKKAKPDEIAEMPEWSAKYFPPETREEIMRILAQKDSMSDFETAAMFGAITLTARACSHYKWSSNQIGTIVEPLRRIDFYGKFRARVEKFSPHLSEGPQALIHEHDTRRLSEVVQPESVDFVYTSPPYFDILDYTSYYTRIIYEMDEGYNRSIIREGLIQKFSSYADDMRVCLREICKVLKPGGQMIFVVGDKKTGDGVINGGEFFAELTDWQPDYVRERGYSGTSSQIWDQVNKTERKEQIIVWTK